MLKERIAKFRSELEMPVTIFCRKVKISSTAFYRYMNNDLVLSDETLGRISDFLSKYGF